MSSSVPIIDPSAESWAVIWKSHTEPRVRSYLWSIGLQPTPEDALTKAEAEARETKRDRVILPALQPSLEIPIPQLSKGEQWGTMWKSKTGPEVYYSLAQDPSPTPDGALRMAQRRIIQLAGLAPEQTERFLAGAFYPVRLDLYHDGELGRFYPVRVDMVMEMMDERGTGPHMRGPVVRTLMEVDDGS